MDLLDDYDFPARTIIECLLRFFFFFAFLDVPSLSKKKKRETTQFCAQPTTAFYQSFLGFHTGFNSTSKCSLVAVSFSNQQISSNIRTLFDRRFPPISVFSVAALKMSKSQSWLSSRSVVRSTSSIPSKPLNGRLFEILSYRIFFLQADPSLAVRLEVDLPGRQYTYVSPQT